jgi:opacity protein-like surface antigen
VKRLFVIFIAVSFLCGAIARSQAVPAAGGSMDTKPSTWNVAGSGSYLGSNTGGSQLNFYGWDASVSEYPYPSFRWLGGTVEMSGHYSGESRTELSNGISYRISVNRTLYTYAGGPSVMLSSGRVKPFAHALFAAINTRTAGHLNGANGSTLRPLDPSLSAATHGGMLLGGGFDIGVTSSVAIRTQADWVQVWAPSQAVNFIHAATGVVYRF